MTKANKSQSEEIIQKSTAKKLLEARNYIGMQVEEAAELTKLKVEEINDIEDSNKKLKKTELDKLAKCYQRPLNYFNSTYEFSKDQFEKQTPDINKLSGKDKDEIFKFVEFISNINITCKFDIKFSKKSSAEKCAKDIAEILDINKKTLLGHRVDIFDCISKVGLVLLFRPLHKLLGAFVCVGNNKGIILNSKRPLGLQRFTAAHEFGHYILGHRKKQNFLVILPREGTDGIRCKSDSVGDMEEKQAQIFASHFLLPSNLIKSQMKIQKWDKNKFTLPQTIYQASLRFGASFEATINVLKREKIIDASEQKKLLKSKPKNIKLNLTNQKYIPYSNRSDVWLITERDAFREIEFVNNDYFLFCLYESPNSGYVWNFGELDEYIEILDDYDCELSSETVGGQILRRVLVKLRKVENQKIRLCKKRPWESERNIETVEFNFKLVPSYRTCLFSSKNR